jgi:hypothetical protein
MLRYTFVTTMLDAGVDLRDVQTAARHADPRTTMRYDRARKNLDRRPHRETRTPRRLTSPYRRRRAPATSKPMCARSGGLMTRACAMTFAVVARLVYGTPLARMSAGQ